LGNTDTDGRINAPYRNVDLMGWIGLNWHRIIAQDRALIDSIKNLHLEIS
jgi:hypothetical protein